MNSNENGVVNTLVCCEYHLPKKGGFANSAFAMVDGVVPSIREISSVQEWQNLCTTFAKAGELDDWCKC